MGRALGSPAGDAAGGPRWWGWLLERAPGLAPVAGPREWRGGRGRAGTAVSRSLSLQDKLAERKALLLQAVQR